MGKHKEKEPPAITPPLHLTIRQNTNPLLTDVAATARSRTPSEEEQPPLLSADGSGGGALHSTQLTGGETKMDKGARAAHLQGSGSPPGGGRAQQKSGLFPKSTGGGAVFSN